MTDAMQRVGLYCEPAFTPVSATLINNSKDVTKAINIIFMLLEQDLWGSAQVS